MKGFLPFALLVFVLFSRAQDTTQYTPYELLSSYYDNGFKPFVNSPLGSFSDYMNQAIFLSTDSSTVILPTHITFVATSSFDGANFSGAIGSTLELDNVIMNYE